jgi:hypothetical protein
MQFPPVTDATGKSSATTTHGFMNSSVIHVVPMQRELQNIVPVMKIVPEAPAVTRDQIRQPITNS